MYNIEFSKIGPCIVAYKGLVIGITPDSPLLNIEPELYEANCNHIGNNAVSKIITNMKITVSAKINRINNAFADFFAGDEGVTNIIFGKDVLTTGGKLSLLPIDGNNNFWYCFLKAVLIPESARACKSMNEYYLKLEFEIYEDSEGVLMQKFS